MEKKMKWGLATLLLLLGIAAVFIFLDQNAELRQLEKETAESDKLRQERNKQLAQLPTETPIDVEQHPQTPHNDEDGTHHDPTRVSVPETPALTLVREGVWKEFRGEKLFFPALPPLETYVHILEDPEATIRKNAAIIVENYGTPAASRARSELNLLQVQIERGYFGGSWSSEAIGLMRLIQEVLYKPLREKGILGPAPPIPRYEGGRLIRPHEGGKTQ